jgi:hypothetical protein
MSTVLPSHERDRDLSALSVEIPVPRPAPPAADESTARPGPPDPGTRRPARSRWAWAAAGITAGVLTGAVGIVAVTAPANVDAGVRAVPTTPLTTFCDGTWDVGRDVAPGTYVAAGSTPACRHTGSPRGQTGVVLGEGPFETAGCGTWSRVG